jgi:hypothetical protein
LPIPNVPITDAMWAFMRKWADAGSAILQANDLPVSAMLACASVESDWGTSTIFKATKNPFNLQKWPWVTFPRTHNTFFSSTVVKEHPHTVLRAPFNCATDEADAVRQWCEWVLHYGEADGPPGSQDSKVPGVRVPALIARRDSLLKWRHSGHQFANNLPLVGFGEGMSKGPVYAARQQNFSMFLFDS